MSEDTDIEFSAVPDDFPRELTRLGDVVEFISDLNDFPFCYAHPIPIMYKTAKALGLSDSDILLAFSKNIRAHTYLRLHILFLDMCEDLITY